MAHFSCFSYFLILRHSPKGSEKYEKIENYLPYCTRHRAITSTFIVLYIINTMKKHSTLLYHVRTYDTKKVPI